MPDAPTKEELRRILEERGEDIPRRLSKMGSSERARLARRLGISGDAPQRPDAVKKPPVAAPMPPTDLPDQVDAGLKGLSEAVRLMVRCRLFAAMGMKDKAKAYKAEAERFVKQVAESCIGVDGTGHERGLKLMRFVALSLVDVHDRFSDYLVSHAVLNTVLSEKVTRLGECND